MGFFLFIQRFIYFISYEGVREDRNIDFNYCVVVVNQNVMILFFMDCDVIV